MQKRTSPPELGGTSDSVFSALILLLIQRAVEVNQRLLYGLLGLFTS